VAAKWEVDCHRILELDAEASRSRTEMDREVQAIVEALLVKRLFLLNRGS